MNPLRDWKRSGLFCSQNHTRREWDLWDEVIEIQIEMHCKGTFPLNAYFLCDWFVWGRLRRFNSPAFPTAFLLFQVLNVPSPSAQAASPDRPSGTLPLSALQFPEASCSGVPTVHGLSRNYIKMEGDLSPWQKLGSLIFKKRCSVSQVILQPFVKPSGVVYRQAFTKGHSWRVQSELHGVLSPKFAFIINNRYCMSKYLLCGKQDHMHSFIESSK